MVAGAHAVGMGVRYKRRAVLESREVAAQAAEGAGEARADDAGAAGAGDTANAGVEDAASGGADPEAR